ncbi:MAG: single-stranded-DNA-specific exonuclease RecJ [Thermoanaerobacteraceae bacterium]|nr:single-stranded-DNA-specific exonuclease RecJ [Thermoanaerobacteraceae bacterium]
MQNMVKKKWRLKEADPLLQFILARDLGISPLTARLLITRGVCTVEDARVFLKGTLEHAGDPFLLAGMERAVERILAAVKQGEKVLVYGDYDVDGITATALLVKVLERLGARVDYYIPNRFTEGYGLHGEALRRAGEEGYRLLVTVDCGISAVAEVAEARSAGGPEIIITDHHQVPEEIPGALAVINPRRKDCTYPFKDLAGVGVALKLAQALLRAAGEGKNAWHDYLDLACLGTVADIVPLTGENRLLVKYGLPKLAATGSPGLKALMQVSGIKPEGMGVRDVGFGLAPRLNAAGRMGDPRRAVELLLCRDEHRAAALAAELDRHNRERQQVESRILADALGMIDGEGYARDRVVVLASPAWHPGVTGIVASRLAESLYRPVLLVALDGEEGRGSGRSIPGFHLYRALQHCREYLTTFGGHAGAAGFSLPAGHIDALRESINQYALSFTSPDLMVPVLDVDARVSLEDISVQLVNELAMLSPHGHGNPEPLLSCLGVSVISCREVGRDGSHLKLLVKENGILREGIGFHLGGHLDNLAAGEALDMAFVPSLDHWNGTVRVQLEIKDLRRTGDLKAVSPDGEDHLLPDRAKDHFLDTLFKEAGDYLPRAAPLLFLPAFVQRKLVEYEERGYGAGLPLDYHPSLFLCTPAGQPGLEIISGAACAATGEGLDSRMAAHEPEFSCRPVDCRGRPERPSWLAGLADGGKPTLVVVSSPHRAVELATYLRRLCSGSGKKAAFCHSWLPPEQRTMVKELFTGGQINVVLATPDMVSTLSEAGPGRMVVYHLPYDHGDWEMIRKAAHKGKVDYVYLPFGPDDHRQARAYLAALVPERDLLARLYALLRQGLGSPGSVPRKMPAGENGHRKEQQWFLYHLAGLLRRAGCPWARSFTVGMGLAVLTELELLQWSPDQYRPVPRRSGGREKIPLAASPTYRWLQELKERAIKWQKYALQAPADLLMECHPGF